MNRRLNVILSNTDIIQISVKIPNNLCHYYFRIQCTLLKYRFHWIISAFTPRFLVLQVFDPHTDNFTWIMFICRIHESNKLRKDFWENEGGPRELRKIWTLLVTATNLPLLRFKLWRKFAVTHFYGKSSAWTNIIYMHTLNDPAILRCGTL